MEIINYKNKTSGTSTPEGFQVYKKYLPWKSRGRGIVLSYFIE